jgi:integrase
LRKLAATRLAEAGCSEHEIAAITGHRSLSEVARYTRARDQARLAEQAMSKLALGMASPRKENKARR